MKRIAILASLVLLFGCSASVQQLADDNNWYQIGYQDGVKGSTHRSYDALNRLGDANITDYEQGYLVGVEEYCNPDFAYQIGLSGSYYEGVCEGTEDGQRFRMEWQRGWSEYNL
ncbi:DUF2799 domain-containing protein [Vibrio maerlii]|uniref:DUF2799 domain-containing protein n=1 Tax=Vibrio maerlii TaxID=2231648 RepID=UPI000E3B5C17|nr:DUF2799 domain-containing protein [Vibrio maerlii]